MLYWKMKKLGISRPEYAPRVAAVLTAGGRAAALATARALIGVAKGHSGVCATEASQSDDGAIAIRAVIGGPSGSENPIPDGFVPP